MFHFIVRFLKLEANSGFLLLAAAAVALLMVNSPFAVDYEAFLAWQPWDWPVSLWINDGLMTFFFLLVGLELRREMVEGELSTRKGSLLPLITAFFGIAVPALIYMQCNWWEEENLRGWAIPSATDIAFSLGVLALFGSRVPHTLRIFLMALAVIDDLAAVIIIAVFYTAELNSAALLMALACIGMLWALNRAEAKPWWPYLILGAVLWMAMLKSGVHPTLAGVALGLLLPLPKGKIMIEKIHPWVAFGVMPIFAFANAGVSLSGLTPEKFYHPVTLGIAAGLFLGKPLGIAGSAWLLCRLRLAKLPEGVNWWQFFAVSWLAGIGFTMSLFIGGLAFAFAPASVLAMKVGIIAGSFLSAVCGCLTMGFAVKIRRH